MTAPLLLLLLFISSTRLQTNDDVSPDAEACFHRAILSFENSHVHLAHYLLFISFFFSPVHIQLCHCVYVCACLCAHLVAFTFL